MIKMKNSNFLQNYQHLQYGIMYNKLIDLGFTSIAWCRKYDSPFFNHAQVDRVIAEQELQEIEWNLQELNRKPAVYFENRSNLSVLTQFLSEHGYEKTWEDSWMFHSGRDITIDNTHVREVETEEQLEEFLKVFNACYLKDDPQNPYGELGDYLGVARDVWLKNSASGKIQYFTVFKENKPVAVSTLTNFAGIGYISNVGSLKEVRGQGFGKIASLHCVAKSVQNGNREHALATEEGSYPNEFYKRIGFRTRFTALGCVKRER